MDQDIPIGHNGQITLPVRARKALKLGSQRKIRMRLSDGKVTLSSPERTPARKSGLLQWLKQSDRPRLTAADCNAYRKLLAKLQGLPVQLDGWEA